MITNLSIKNYALIKDLSVAFSSGLTIVTGETGAGKSILLDALSLVMGRRADNKVVRNPNEKCIVEAEFYIAHYNLKNVFLELELDYEDQTFLRREILPTGKSRAFVNDSPASLQQVQKLGSYLIDIHSQFDTQNLFSEEYQLEIIDTLAGNGTIIKQYKEILQNYFETNSSLEKLELTKETATKELDYHQFLYEELKQANLASINQIELEETFEQLNNAEEIQEVLSKVSQVISEDNLGVLTNLFQIRNELGGIKKFSKNYEEIWARINSLCIELEDISEEVQNASENLESEPELLQQAKDTLQNLYRLQQKHQVSNVEALQEIETDLEDKVSEFENVDEHILKLKNKKEELKNSLEKIASKISEERKKVFPKLKEQLEFYLRDLGLPNAHFLMEISTSNDFRKQGKDNFSMLFSANKGVVPGPIQKIASGGELSRVMLSLKAVIASFKNLPTIIFDEIDTGVSGEIAHKMAMILSQMSKKGQLISITHLPQIAAKGDYHKKVYKVEGDDSTVTQIADLTSEERIVEIAQMIGGSTVSESAIAHAKQLLN